MNIKQTNDTVNQMLKNNIIRYLKAIFDGQTEIPRRITCPLNVFIDTWDELTGQSEGIDYQIDTDTNDYCEIKLTYDSNVYNLYYSKINAYILI